MIRSALVHRWFLLIVWLVLFASLTRPAPGRPAPQDEPAALQINTDVVLLHVSVQNDHREFVSGLEKENFQVFEDGRLQEIDSFHHEDVSVTVGLVMDNSGSMRPKRAEAIAAGLAFARSSNPRDQIFVVNFNEHVSFGLPAGTAFTDQVPHLERALAKNAANGMTALYDGLAVAFAHLKKGNQDKQVLLAISDGGDNASRHTLAQIMALARQSEVIIYTVTIFDVNDKDRNFKVLRELAKATGGEAFQVDSATEAIPLCVRIARDIRTQYSLTYVPTNLKYDGTFRTIQVKVTGRERKPFSVRTRSGYFAPLAAGPSKD